MFKLKADDTFTWPVKAKTPDDGKFKTVTFSAVFNILPQTEITGLMGDEGDESAGALRVLDAALVSFTDIDVEGDDGETVTDHDERQEIIFKYPFMVTALTEAFAAGTAGRRLKN